MHLDYCIDEPSAHQHWWWKIHSILSAFSCCLSAASSSYLCVFINKHRSLCNYYIITCMWIILQVFVPFDPSTAFPPPFTWEFHLSFYSLHWIFFFFMLLSSCGGSLCWRWRVAWVRVMWQYAWMEQSAEIIKCFVKPRFANLSCEHVRSVKAPWDVWWWGWWCWWWWWQTGSPTQNTHTSCLLHRVSKAEDVTGHTARILLLEVCWRGRIRWDLLLIQSYLTLRSITLLKHFMKASLAPCSPCVIHVECLFPQRESRSFSLRAVTRRGQPSHHVCFGAAVCCVWCGRWGWRTDIGSPEWPVAVWALQLHLQNQHGGFIISFHDRSGGGARGSWEEMVKLHESRGKQSSGDDDTDLTSIAFNASATAFTLTPSYLKRQSLPNVGRRLFTQESDSGCHKVSTRSRTLQV